MIYYNDLLIFPDNINNLIFLFVGKNKICYLMEDLIENKYENDFHPYFIKNYFDFYKFKYSFNEWYFNLIRRKLNECNIKKRKYKNTPHRLKVGYDKICYKS
jgi:hypothetical protein